jgi:hypothetical protein
MVEMTETILIVLIVSVMSKYETSCSERQRILEDKYMNQKTITHLEHPRNMHMVGDGFRVANYLP